MKFCSNKCDRIIDINKNSPSGKKNRKKKDILKTPHTPGSEAMENFEKNALFRCTNPAIGVMAHVFRLGNLKEGTQILN